MANTPDRTGSYSVVSPKKESKVSYSAGSRKKKSKVSYSVPPPKRELLEVNKSTDDLPGMSTPTNHLPAELAPITKSLDMIERDISDSPLEPMSLDGDPKREIPAEILGLEERYIKDTPKQESNSGSGFNAIEHSADVKKQEEDSVSVILPPTPSIPSSISKIEAQVNEHAGYVKKKKKGSFLVLPPPETLKPPAFDYIAPSIGGGNGSGGTGGISGYSSGTVAGSGSNPEPKQVDSVVPKAVPPDSSDIGNNGGRLALALGDASETAKGGKLFDFIILVVVLICLGIGLLD
jgi:hypothetical protein